MSDTTREATDGATRGTARGATRPDQRLQRVPRGIDDSEPIDERDLLLDEGAPSVTGRAAVGSVELPKEDDAAVSAVPLLDDAEIQAPPRHAPFLIGSVLALALAEYLVAFVAPGWGLAIHAGLLLAFMARSVLSVGYAHDLYLALSMLPLIRVLAIAMPFWLTDQSAHFALVNLPLIVATLLAARYLHYGRRELGLRLGFLPWQLAISLTGPLIGYIERLIIQPPALAPDLSLQAVWWPALSLLLFTGLSEELLFRGVLQTAAVRALGARWGIVTVAVMFGVLHIGWQSALDVAFVTVVGLFFGWAVYRTRSILGVTLAHGIANIVLLIVLPNLGT